MPVTPDPPPPDRGAHQPPADQRRPRWWQCLFRLGSRAERPADPLVEREISPLSPEQEADPLSLEQIRALLADQEKHLLSSISDNPLVMNALGKALVAIPSDADRSVFLLIAMQLLNFVPSSSKSAEWIGILEQLLHDTDPSQWNDLSQAMFLALSPLNERKQVLIGHIARSAKGEEKEYCLHLVQKYWEKIQGPETIDHLLQALRESGENRSRELAIAFLLFSPPLTSAVRQALCILFNMPKKQREQGVQYFSSFNPITPVITRLQEMLDLRPQLLSVSHSELWLILQSVICGQWKTIDVSLMEDLSELYRLLPLEQQALMLKVIALIGHSLGSDASKKKLFRLLLGVFTSKEATHQSVILDQLGAVQPEDRLKLEELIRGLCHLPFYELTEQECQKICFALTMLARSSSHRQMSIEACALVYADKKRREALLALSNEQQWDQLSMWSLPQWHTLLEPEYYEKILSQMPRKDRAQPGLIDHIRVLEQNGHQVDLEAKLKGIPVPLRLGWIEGMALFIQGESESLSLEKLDSFSDCLSHCAPQLQKRVAEYWVQHSEKIESLWSQLTIEQQAFYLQALSLNPDQPLSWKALEPLFNRCTALSSERQIAVMHLASLIPECSIDTLDHVIELIGKKRLIIDALKLILQVPPFYRAVSIKHFLSRPNWQWGPWLRFMMALEKQTQWHSLEEFDCVLTAAQGLGGLGDQALNWVDIFASQRAREVWSQSIEAPWFVEDLNTIQSQSLQMALVDAWAVLPADQRNKDTLKVLIPFLKVVLLEHSTEYLLSFSLDFCGKSWKQELAQLTIDLQSVNSLGCQCFIPSLLTLSKEDRALVTTLIGPNASALQRQAALMTVSLLPPQDRVKNVLTPWVLQEGLLNRVIEAYLLPPLDRKAFLLSSSSLKESLERRETLSIEEWNQYIEERLKRETNPLVVQGCIALMKIQAPTLLSEGVQLLMHDTSYLAEGAAAKGPKNPYHLFFRARLQAREGTDLPAPLQECNGKPLRVKVPLISSSQGGSDQELNAHPRVTLIRFQALAQKLHDHLKGMSVSDQTTLLHKYSRLSLKQIDELVCHSFFVNLLEPPLQAQQSASLQRRQLYACLDYLLALPDTPEPNERLSIQDMQWLLFCSDTFSCPAGKQAGITQFYRHIQQVQGEASSLADDELSEVIVHAVETLFEPNSPFLHALVGSKEADQEALQAQLSHQVIFVKNAIAPLIGLAWDLTWDFYTAYGDNLSQRLSLCSQEHILSTFYEHCTPIWLAEQYAGHVNQQLQTAARETALLSLEGPLSAQSEWVLSTLIAPVTPAECEQLDKEGRAQHSGKDLESWVQAALEEKRVQAQTAAEAEWNDMSLEERQEWVLQARCAQITHRVEKLASSDQDEELLWERNAQGVPTALTVQGALDILLATGFLTE